MSPSLVRWSGLAAVLGGVLWVLLVPLITLTYPGGTGWASVEAIFSTLLRSTIRSSCVSSRHEAVNTRNSQG